MKRNLIFRGQWLVTTLILAISLGAYGCADTASVSEDVAAPLASLTVTPGTLQPGFLANTTNYAVNAPTSATSVTVTAVPKDNTAIVTIDGVVTSQRSVTLGGPGSTKIILIVVEALNGLETTYTVTVTRLLSSDNNLSALTVTQGALNPSPFNADTLDYTVDVATNVTSVTVTATKSDPNAVMTGSLTAGAGVATGQATIALGGPGTATPVTITVTAPNGSAKTYNITVNRLSNDNNLSALSVTPGSLDPTFAASTLLYMVNVATDVTEVTVTATKSDPNAVLSGSVADPGAGQATGQATIPLNGAGTPTSISITVTAPSGASQTYTVTVNRAAPSSDANLAALTVTGGPLVPDFAPGTTTYTVDVPFSVDSVTVSATKSDPNAVMSGDVTAGTGVPTGQATFPLIPLFPRTVSITVTAPNGNSMIYSVTIIRALF
ncbi:MAG: cadherin-like beta sandwich domain-containing protein [Nitrospira sp.]|nr:MAG: cadherin-like beta sandwich domain-containing protein [Nitrospira sp.]